MPLRKPPKSLHSLCLDTLVSHMVAYITRNMARISLFADFNRCSETFMAR